MSLFSQSGCVELTFQKYGANGALGFLAVNTFWRQIRNFVIDFTALPPTIPPSSSNLNGAVAAIHWPTAQATSLQNIIFQLSAVPGNQHQGVFIESGSGGFVTDLVFNNGFNGMVLDNQYVTIFCSLSTLLIPTLQTIHNAQSQLHQHSRGHPTRLRLGVVVQGTFLQRSHFGAQY
jgi:hypothetical protein